MSPDAYANQIKRTEPFVPCDNGSTTALDDAIEAAASDRALTSFFARYSVPPDALDRRRWLQAALNQRPPGNLPEVMISATDRLLQQELAQNTITKANELPRLSGPTLRQGK